MNLSKLRFILSKCFLATGMLGIGFVVAAIFIHTFFTKPLNLYAEYRSEKLALLRQTTGHVRYASFGSSHVHNGFDPRVYDQISIFNNDKSRSINLAIEGGSQTEQRVMAKEFLLSVPAKSQPQTCQVLLELNAGTNFHPRHFFHPRTINIYDFDTALFAVYFTDKKLGFVTNFGRVMFSMSAMVMHYANVGMLSSAIFQTNKMNMPLFLRQTNDDRRGFLSEPFNERESKEVYEKLTQIDVHHSHFVNLVSGNEKLIRDLKTLRSNCNPQFFYFVTPNVSDVTDHPEYPSIVMEGNTTVPIFNFARPSVYPDLYQPELWHDTSHLNESGAKVFTHALALEVQQWVSSQSMQSETQD